jgi:hypothetical protein
MDARPRVERQLIVQGLYALRRLWRHRERAAPSVYLAFSIGPEMLAVGVWELDARNDEAALEKATPLFNKGLQRIEVWCGSRKVGQFPPNGDDAAA